MARTKLSRGYIVATSTPATIPTRTRATRWNVVSLCIYLFLPERRRCCQPLPRLPILPRHTPKKTGRGLHRESRQQSMGCRPPPATQTKPVVFWNIGRWAHAVYGGYNNVTDYENRVNANSFCYKFTIRPATPCRAFNTATFGFCR